MFEDCKSGMRKAERVPFPSSHGGKQDGVRSGSELFHVDRNGVWKSANHVLNTKKKLGGEIFDNI